MHVVHERVLQFIGDTTTGSFDALALEVFAHQFEEVAAYRQFCVSRNCTPETVRDWRQIPAVPIRAFKGVDLACGPPQRIFLSTGTTEGATMRSRHLVPDLRLYHGSAIAAMHAFVFPNVARMRLVSLVPPADVQQESSLAQMITWAFEEFADSGSRFVVDGHGMDFETMTELLRECERSGEPCCLLATTGALILFLDWAHDFGLTFRLPHGSRLMDTGGDKGAPRRMSRRGLLHACWSTFGIPSYFCVNEYGMAELSSQFFDNVIANRAAGRFARRYKIGPPWTRTLVVDPGSMTPVEEGQRGLLCHFDLANTGSTIAVQTEDIGYAIGDGFELVGRAVGAEVRGCSLSIAEWQAAQDPSSHPTPTEEQSL